MARLVSATRAGSCGIKQLSLAGDSSREERRASECGCRTPRAVQTRMSRAKRPILGTVSPTSGGGSGPSAESY